MILKMMLKADCQSLTIFLLCLLNVVHIRAQCSAPNISDNRVLTNSSKPSYSDGDTLIYQCSVGYQPVDPRASKSITCSGNRWTDLALQCKKKSCGPLPEISNGRYIYSPEGDEGILFGATATAQCNEGYVLAGQAGNAYRNCRNDGWDGGVHFCEVVKCPKPPQISNGMLDEDPKDEYEYGQAVTYVCDDGFTLFGERNIACSENGTFPPPPRCTRVSCVQPDVKNGKRIAGRAPYGYKSFIEFECDPDFKLSSSGRLVCEENEWQPPPPVCIELPTPPTPPTPPTTTTTTTRSTTKDVKVHPTSPPNNNGGRVGPIVGGIFGAIAILGLGVCAFLYCKKKSSTEGYSGNVATKSEEGPL